MSLHDASVRASSVLVAILVATLTFAGTVEGGLAVAWAIDQDRGHPGFCHDDKGVTVVVDFRDLGGTTIVRCHPGAATGTGLDALKGAGFQVEGVQRWGESFVCRIENRPAAAEVIEVAGQGYRERCLDTPPAAGYWSYWHAGNGCAWEYSKWGVKNRSFLQGGFEGWSFSLNAPADTNPEPRIAAVRPGTEARPCTTLHESGPVTADPDETRPGGGAGPSQHRSPTAPAPDAAGGGSEEGGAAVGAGDGGRGAPLDQRDPDPRSASSDAAVGADANDHDGTGEQPDPSTDSATADPSRNVEFTGGEEAADVRTELADRSGSASLAPWMAAGVLAGLAAATVLTSRRRRAAGDR